MALTLQIQNMASLPDGGPLSYTVKGKRGFDIGRDRHLDWTLPDPNRFISGKHCEVRWRDGGYWLHDLSANGTFLDGADSRLKAPHRLRDGDRFAIGHYIVAVTLDNEGMPVEAEAPVGIAPSYDVWNTAAESAPAIDPRELKGARDFKPVKPDFLDWAIDVPAARQAPPSADVWAAVPPVAPVDSWLQDTPKPPPPAPEAGPSQRRSAAAVASSPDDPWAAPRTPVPPIIAPDAAANLQAAAAATAATTVEVSDPANLPAKVPDAENPSLDVPSQPAATLNGDAVPLRASEAVSITEFVRLVTRGAGLPEDVLAARDPAELAAQLGQLMRLVTDNMKMLLDARQQTKRIAHSANQTMIQALDNNPLKFCPTVDDAMRFMFGPPTRGYLGAQRALTQGFADVKEHQLKTYVAMQQAMRMLLEELDPAAIDAATKADRGLVGAIGSRKARLWDIYVARWQARTQYNKDGMLNVFMDYFAKCYDRGGADP